MEDRKKMGPFTQAEEQFLFYYELGRALSQWGMLESSLGRLATAKDAWSERSEALMSAYAKIENFRSKLNFVDAYLRHDFATDQPLLAKWAGLMDECKTAATKRNQIAHRTTIAYEHGIEGRRVGLIEFMRWEKEVLHVEHRKMPVHNGESLCLLNLVKIKEEFFRLHVRLGNFQGELRGTPARLPEAFEREPDLPTLRALRLQLRSALEPQPQPSRA